LRGVVSAFITSRLKNLGSDMDKPATLELAEGMACKLDALDSGFKTHHALVYLDEQALLREQTHP
jgi:hypothetical protein